MWYRIGSWIGTALVIGAGVSGCMLSSVVPEEERLSDTVAEQLVTWDDFNAEWLAAAIFAETNRVRATHDLPAYRSQYRLAGAADLQATTIALTGVASHHNPLAGRANVMDRVRAQGLAPVGAWENVASTLVRSPASGGPVRISINEQGKRLRFDDNTGEPLGWPTYAELAKRIVQQWMDSPPHRLNVLATEPTRMACGTALSRSALGGEVVHSIQVFIAKKPL